MSGWYDVAEIECAGCAATREHVRAQPDGHNGAHLKYAVVDTYDDAEMGCLRPMPPLAAFVQDGDGIPPEQPPDDDT